MIYNIFLIVMFYLVSNGYLYNTADDDCINVSHKDIRMLSTQLESETQILAKFLLAIPWKQTQINSKGLYYRWAVIIKMFELHWGM